MGEYADQMGVCRHAAHGGAVEIHQTEIVGILLAELVFEGEVALDPQRAEFRRFPCNFDCGELVRGRRAAGDACVGTRFAALGDPVGDAEVRRAAQLLGFPHILNERLQFRHIAVGVKTDEVGVRQKAVVDVGPVEIGSRTGRGEYAAADCCPAAGGGKDAGNRLGECGDIFRWQRVPEPDVRLVPDFEGVLFPMRGDGKPAVPRREEIVGERIVFRGAAAIDLFRSGPCRGVVKCVEHMDFLLLGDSAVETETSAEVECSPGALDRTPVQPVPVPENSIVSENFQVSANPCFVARRVAPAEGAVHAEVGVRLPGRRIVRHHAEMDSEAGKVIFVKAAFAGGCQQNPPVFGVVVGISGGDLRAAVVAATVTE